MNPHIARVVIVNTTQKPLEGLTLIHRFGDRETPEILQWNTPLPPRRQSASQNVNFATGLGATTDFDWWTISWRTENKMKHLLMPSTLNILSDISFMQGGSLFTYAGSSTEKAVTPSLTAAGAGLASALAATLFSSALRKTSKLDYKEHMLKEEDAYDCVTSADKVGLRIIINNSTVEFVSPSGSSTANYISLETPGALAEKDI